MEEITVRVAFEIGCKVEFDNKQGKDSGVVCGINLRPGGAVFDMFLN